MKKSLIIIFTICFSAIVTAQESDKNNADYDFGNGISFSFNDGDYLFNIYGFIRPTYIYNDMQTTMDNGIYNEVSRQFKSKN